MALMAPFAQKALQDRVPPAERATTLIWPGSQCLSPLESRVRRLLEQLYDSGQLTGCQVCVFRYAVTQYAGQC
jgi:hypothetical protein